MKKDLLSRYMNDHLAGSIVALELLDHLTSLYAGTPTETVLRDLRRETVQDRELLSVLIHEIGGTEDRVRKSIAWVSEKVVRAKLLVEDPANQGLGRLEKVEALAIGIDGKRALWECLQNIALVHSAWQNRDWARLIERANQQRRTVESLRLEAAREAFS